MRIDLVVYSVLLVIGLGLAYWVSLPGDNTSSDEEKVSVLNLDKKSIAELSYLSPETDTKAQLNTESGQYWITFSKKPKPPEPQKEEKKDGKKDEAKPEAKPDQTKVKEKKEVAKETAEKKEEAKPQPPLPPPEIEKFLANEKMEDLLASFNPLQALRVIGKIEDAKSLEEFGLKDSKEKIIIETTDKKKFEFLVGKKSYGSPNLFIQDMKDGRVLLVKNSPFDDLKKSNYRLFERRLVTFNIEDVTKATVKSGDKAKILVHTKKDDSGKLKWTDDEENAPIKESYENWVDKIMRLRVLTFAKDDEVAKITAAAPLFEVTFEKNGKILDTLVFKKYGQETFPLDKTEGGKSEQTTQVYWVESTFLKTFAKMSQNRLDPIEKDVANILQGK